VSDGTPPLAETGNRVAAVDRPGRTRWQVGLRTLFLLLAAIAVWLTYFVNLRHNASLERRINAMVPLAHELIVDDPKKVAAVKLEQHWFEENRWELYLPDGTYRLCLATRGIAPAGLAPIVKSAPIASGTHQLALERQQNDDGSLVTVLWDGKALMEEQETKDWSAKGSTSSVNFAQSEQRSPDTPIEFLRLRFMHPDGKGRSTTPTGPTQGILLWIEQAAPTKAQP
jgi:hypothetical protein